MLLPLVDCFLTVFLNLKAATYALYAASLVVPLWMFVAKPLLNGLQLPVRLPWETSASTRRETSPSRRGENLERPVNKQKAMYPRFTGTEVDRTRGFVSSKTEEALQELFCSPRFAQWYKVNRGSFLEQMQLRSAQQIWASLAMTVVLLLAVFVLPFFSFKNEDAALWTLLRRRYDTKNSWGYTLATFVASILQLLALATLFTTAFMPRDAKPTALAALVAFFVLVIEAAMVESLMVGAGFMVLIGVVMWRAASAWG